jgi:hypothetical protein
MINGHSQNNCGHHEKPMGNSKMLMRPSSYDSKRL